MSRCPKCVVWQRKRKQFIELGNKNDIDFEARRLDDYCVCDIKPKYEDVKIKPMIVK